jgi:hypothetical protein
MLLSPPYLVPRAANQSDAAWVEQCMSLDGTQGRYPVAYALQWHGGLHLKAPAEDNGAPMSLRAIADGKVVFLRQPTAFSDSPTHALQYGNDVPDNAKASGTASVWTDDGCVVLEHITEIGANGDTPVSVTFYSVYMHLHSIEAAVQLNKTLYRKDKLGEPGRIYGGTQDRCHFEIVCDNDNLQALIGRTSGDLPLAAHGRSDAVFGEIYFYLPKDTPLYTPSNNAVLGNLVPLGNLTTATIQPPPSAANQPAPAPVTLASTPLSDAMIVGLRYDEGYALTARGSAQLASYQLDGAAIGAPLVEAEAEYNLYDTATDISKSYPANAQPAPSAVYELLRFGRVLNTANETLAPADVSHWRKVNTPDGIRWVNLNTASIKIFSDADCPQWKQWKVVDDGGQGADSRCDSAALRALLDVDGNGEVTPAEASAAYASVQDKMKHVIAKFPSEWDKTNIDGKWAWLKTSTAENTEPLTSADFSLFTAHLEKLSFWSDVPALPKDPWHFNPITFIQHFRQCGWLSNKELANTFPRHMFYTSSGNPRTAIKTPAAIYALPRSQADTRMAAHTIPMNLAMRKYVGAGKKRTGVFLSQILLETAQWRDLGGTKMLMHEWGFGAYSAANPMTQYYAAFYGRGIMQLTWAGNYKDYGLYRQLPSHTGSYTERLTPAAPRITAASTHHDKSPNDGGTQFQWSPLFDPDIVATNNFAACDSGGFYWVSKTFSEGKNINRVSDRAYTTENIGFVNRLVNGGGNGYYERQAYTAFMLRLLDDCTDSQETITLTLPTPKANIRVDFLRPTS